MTEVDSIAPALALTVPVVVAVLVIASARHVNVRDSLSIAGAVVTFVVVAYLLPKTISGEIPETTLFELAPGISIAFRADPAAMVFALLAAFLWVPTAVYSIGYMRGLNEANQTRFYTAFALSIAATLGVAFSANLLTFVLFYELLTLMTYPLVVHRQTTDAIMAGRKYLAYTLSGGLALIAATVWIISLDIDSTFLPGGIFGAGTDSTTSWGIFILLAFGVGVKAAVMPFHSWLPNAMVAPTPVSALLHAVAVVKAGAFGFIRVMGFIFGPTMLEEMGAWFALAAFSSATIIIASVIALKSDNLKRRLAYSTVSQLSYIVLGTALLGSMAWTGAIMHVVAHGVTKITLFFCAGAIHIRTHKEKVSELNGIGRVMPITMAAFAIASLGMVGIPPFAMFGSKFLLGLGAIETGHPLILIIYLGSGLLNAAYLLPIVYRSFFRSADIAGSNEAPLIMVLPIALTASLALILGLFPDMLFEFYTLASKVGTSLEAIK